MFDQQILGASEMLLIVTVLSFELLLQKSLLLFRWPVDLIQFVDTRTGIEPFEKRQIIRGYFAQPDAGG